MPHFTGDNLKKCLAPRLGPDIVLCTDGHLTFEVFAAGEQLQHEVINASQGEKVRKGVFHIQGEQLPPAVEGMDGSLPRCRYPIPASLPGLVSLVQSARNRKSAAC